MTLSNGSKLIIREIRAASSLRAPVALTRQIDEQEDSQIAALEALAGESDENPDDISDLDELDDLTDGA